MGLSKEKSYVVSIRIKPNTGKLLRLHSILSGEPMSDKIGKAIDKLANRIDFSQEFGLPQSVVDNYLKMKFQKDEVIK